MLLRSEIYSSFTFIDEMNNKHCIYEPLFIDNQLQAINVHLQANRVNVNLLQALNVHTQIEFITTSQNVRRRLFFKRSVVGGRTASTGVDCRNGLKIGGRIAGCM